MTISNNRPYTYPDGLIDIPSHTGREGGVKFTDFAIGKFLEAAQKKPWFDNTIFVIVADHCHSSAGKNHIPVWKYHIPLIIYAPKIIAPQKIDRVGGQIDVAPTLLSLMNFRYKSQFLGRNLLVAHKHERALLGTFQNLGLLEDGKLYVMSPQGREEFYTVEMNSLRFTQKKTAPISALKKKAIAYYQYASWLWHSKKMKVKK
jgi:phosphoglycerol transferase MdoB-like AlkP superfamily enzyme